MLTDPCAGGSAPNMRFLQKTVGLGIKFSNVNLAGIYDRISLKFGPFFGIMRAE